MFVCESNIPFTADVFALTRMFEFLKLEEDDFKRVFVDCGASCFSCEFKFLRTHRTDYYSNFSR